MSFAGIELGPLLGTGTYGNVYNVQYKGRNCALKILNVPKDNVGLPELSELNALSNIKHPNLIELIDFKIEGNKLGFILPLAKYDLQNAIKLEANRVFIDKWIYEILSAIFFLHKNGFYHCDIKTSNILILDDNRACLADFGFVKRAQISTITCQTIMSPQLLQRRDRRYYFNWGYRNDALIEQHSNEFQDDIWATGFTIYVLLGHYYPQTYIIRYNDKESYLEYIISSVWRGENFFGEKGIPQKYVPLLLALMNPDAPSRSLNLLGLLGSPALAGYSNYVDGEVVSVKNKHPITEPLMKDLKYFLSYVMKVKYIDDYVRAQLVDLCYRCTYFCNFMSKKTDDSVKLNRIKIIKAVIGVLIIVDKLDIAHSIPGEYDSVDEFILYETELLNYLEGHVTRKIFADYIDKSKYKRCIDWIIENPERYEQMETEVLVQHFNSLFP